VIELFIAFALAVAGVRTTRGRRRPDAVTT